MGFSVKRLPEAFGRFAGWCALTVGVVMAVSVAFVLMLSFVAVFGAAAWWLAGHGAGSG